MSDDTRPRPEPSPESRPFWEGCREGELRLQRCRGCGQTRFPPGPVCPTCLDGRARWTAASGRGRIHTFVTYRRAYHPAFEDRLPYVVAVIELEEGPRMISNIVGTEPERIRCDQPVEVVFERRAEGVVVPVFRLAAHAEARTSKAESRKPRSGSG